jgi:hypothetical protein
LDLFGLAGEDDLTIIFITLASILKVLYKNCAVRRTINFLTLSDVLTDSKEGNLFIVRAVLGSQINNLGGQLILDCIY